MKNLAIVMILLLGCEPIEFEADETEDDSSQEKDEGSTDSQGTKNTEDTDTTEEPASDDTDDTSTDEARAAEWTLLRNEVSNSLRALWVSEDGSIFACGADGLIIHSSDALHEEWIQMDSGTSFHLNDLWGTSSSNVYAVGGNKRNGSDTGMMLHFDGKTWQEVLRVSADEDIRGIWGSSNDDIYAFGEELSVAYHFNGEAWSPLDCEGKGCPDSGTDIWGSGPSDIWVSGYDGVHHYDGASWSLVLQEMSNLYSTVWGTANDDVYVGSMYSLKHWNGNHWEDVPLNSLVQERYSDASPQDIIYAIGGARNNDVYVYAETLLDDEPNSFNMFHFDGIEWTIVPGFENDKISDIWGVPNGGIYALGSQGKIWYKKPE